MARHPDEIDEDTLRLLIAPGVGPATVRRLLAHFGSAAAAVGATASALAAVDGMARTAALALRRALGETDPAAERSALLAAGVRLVLRGDDDYPVFLATIPSPPEALWLRGDLVAEDRMSLAVVGSRRPTAYGREQAARFAALLAPSGLSIVSGGARGIDAAAHRGALRAGGRTIAVLGSGLARCYPPEHARLFDDIVAGGGALLSEHAMGVPPLPGHFPRRNRIISGLSLGVLIVEAAARSGALITARLAAEDHGREVMALPGRIDSPASAGCNQLIRDGGAGLVTSSLDVVRQLDIASQQTRATLEVAGLERASTRGSLFDGELTASQQAIVDALAGADSPLPVDMIADRSGGTLAEILADVTILEVRGRLVRDEQGLRLA